MPRNHPACCLSLALLCALPAMGQVVIQDGTPGLYGTPYVYLGWRDAELWENYVKDDSQHVPALPVPSLAAGQRSNPVTYQQVITGYTDGSNYAFAAPGLFVGRARSTRSYPEAGWTLLATRGESDSRYLDVRVGFGEHLAAGGGASFATMIANNGGGGAGSPMDLYQGNWGVDGVEMHLILASSGNWSVTAENCYLVAPTSPNEITRTDHTADAVVTGGTQQGPAAYATTLPGTEPLPIRWSLDQTGGSSRLVVVLNEEITVTWTFDDGVSRHGLTDPGNPGGEPYQNGSLDPASFVPLLYVGMGENSTDNTTLAEIQVPIAQAVSGPVLSGLPATVTADAQVPLTVSWINDQGQVDTTNTGTVHFESADPADVLPPDSAFTAGDQGTHAFQARFSTPGSHSVTVSRVSLPALRSSLGTQVSAAQTEPPPPVTTGGRHRRGPFDVGFNCSTSGSLPPLLWPGLAWLALARRRRPAATAAAR